MSRAYPRKVEILRAVEAAKSCGIAVAGIEVTPDGTIRVLGPVAMNEEPSEFDKWERAGRI